MTESDLVGTGDDELLLASAGQPEVFALFYDRHALPVLTYFARRTFDPEVAADLTAERFAQAFASRHRFRTGYDGGAEAWIFTIARRQLSRFNRRRRVEVRARERLGMAARPLDAADYERIEALIDFEAVGRSIAGALTKLSPDQRDAIALRVLEARSYADVARAVGCSEAVARARVSRGLHRLRTLLETPPGSVS